MGRNAWDSHRITQTSNYLNAELEGQLEALEFANGSCIKHVVI